MKTAAYAEAALRADPACRLLVLWQARWMTMHRAQVAAILRARG